jgi:hypothetical protein
LRPLEPKPLKPLAAFIAAYHLGDPIGPGDAWRPWRRGRAAAKEAAAVRRIADAPAEATPSRLSETASAAGSRTTARPKASAEASEI